MMGRFNAPKQAHIEALLGLYVNDPNVIEPNANDNPVVTSYDNNTLREFLNP